jgi:hypothetical protein
MRIDELTPLLCSRCGRPLDGIDPDEEPAGWDGQPLCGECVREREFIDQEVEMQEADDLDE